VITSVLCGYSELRTQNSEKFIHPTRKLVKSTAAIGHLNIKPKIKKENKNFIKLMTH
jgi:hypothetical protein